LTAILANNFVNVSAINIDDINRKNLESFKNRDVFDASLFNYLSKRNITQEEYEETLEIMEGFKGSDCVWWYELESGTVFYDEILFSHPKIKEIYNDLKSKNKSLTETELRDYTKQKLIASPESVNKILQESLDKYADLNGIFKKIFKRNASSSELNWMKKLSTLKYAAYSGKLNGISSADISTINNGEGEALFGISSHEGADFYEYGMKKRYKIEKLEIDYRRIYGHLSTVRDVIWTQYKRDINVVLTENEMMNIYKNSVVDITMDYNLALYNTKLKLIEKGIIPKADEPVKPEIENPKDENNSSDDKVEVNDYIDNPKQEIENYNKELSTLNPELYKILSALKIDYSKFMTSVSAYVAKDNKELYFKYNGVEYKTGLMDKEGKFTSEVARILLQLIVDKVEGKIVYSNHKTMILIENKIVVLDEIGNEDKEVILSYIQKELKNLNIDLYYKNISKK
ncbi:MAG: hypothetical protein IJH34_11125, partial [Romboutsia sp.]|nr:hypothetical protein [Romboutsia sp.]